MATLPSFSLFDSAVVAGVVSPESDPHGLDSDQPGAKLDSGKPRVWLMAEGFAPALARLMEETSGSEFVSELLKALDALNAYPRALEEVAHVTSIGAKKYTPNGWMLVEDGYNRYLDAYGRHALSYAKGEIIDSGEGGTGCFHQAQMIWNLLAAWTLGSEAGEDEDTLSDLIQLALYHLRELEATLLDEEVAEA